MAGRHTSANLSRLIMGRISTAIGLFTGFPIEETVNKLIELQARPRQNLVAKNKSLEDEQVAITSLTASLIALQTLTNKLSLASLYESKSAASSHSDLLTATASSLAQLGSYQFTPVRRAQAQHLQSSAFTSRTAPIGTGTLAFRFGGFVDQGAGLDVIAGGAGFARGKLQITDRSGQTAIVDLSFARTIDDVLLAISDHAGINVTASVVGDAIRLTDDTGQSLTNLKVQEAGGTAAQSLGLGGIDVAASQATSADIVKLFGNLTLDQLNDGGGVRFNAAAPDLRMTFRDNSAPLEIDFKRLASAGPPAVTATNELRVQDVLDTINAYDPARLRASLSPDGDSIVLEDLTTTGAGSFTVTAINDSKAARDLGLDVSAVGGKLTGRRVQSGLKTTLLTSLAGGLGLNNLGLLSLTDRSGANATVNLASARTLDDVIEAINAAPVGITARYNRQRHGIELVDTTGAVASNLIVANGDGSTTTADRLGLSINAAVTSKSSGDLQRQVVNENTLLSRLNGGAGVATGTFKVADTTGATGTVTINDSTQTVGDVIKAIQNLGLAIDVGINDAGDGIELTDTAHGSGTVSVAAGDGTTAADLSLLAAASLVDISGTPTYVLDGSTTRKITITAEDSLDTLVAKINAAGGVAAAVTNDGSTVSPFRLSLTSRQAGLRGALLVDDSAAPFALTQTLRAADALLSLGGGTAAEGLLISSATNKFTDVLPGLSLEIKQASLTPVTISVNSQDQPLLDAVQSIVDAYNKLRDKIEELTAFDETTQTGAILHGESSVLRVETELADLLTRRILGTGPIQSLGTIGLSVSQGGDLVLDVAKLKEKLASQPTAVKDLLSKAEVGVSDRFKKEIEILAGVGNSLLVSRAVALSQKISQNEERIKFLDERLEASRQRLLRQFQNSELAIAKMQTALTALDSLAALPPLTATSQS